MSTTGTPCMVNGVKFGVYQNCAINLWDKNGKDFRTCIAKLNELITDISARYSEGAILMIVIGPGSALPDGGERRELAEFFTRWAPSWRAIARVAEGTDLWSMTARSIMGAIHLVQRNRYPAKIFSEVDSAADWLNEYIVRPEGQSLEDTARGLKACVDELRRMAA